MWFVFGFIIGAGLLLLGLWVRNKGIVVKWYEWLFGIISLCLLLFMIQNIIGSIREMEAYAAWHFLWMIGLPAIIFLMFALWLPWRRYRKSNAQED